MADDHDKAFVAFIAVAHVDGDELAAEGACESHEEQRSVPSAALLAGRVPIIRREQEDGDEGDLILGGAPPSTVVHEYRPVARAVTAEASR